MDKVTTKNTADQADDYQKILLAVCEINWMAFNLTTIIRDYETLIWAKEKENKVLGNHFLGKLDAHKFELNKMCVDLKPIINRVSSYLNNYDAISKLYIDVLNPGLDVLFSDSDNPKP